MLFIIEKLEKNAIETVYSEIFFNFSDYGENSYSKEFMLNALKDGRFSFDCVIESDLSTANMLEVKIFANNILVSSFTNSSNGKVNFSFETPLNKGINIIRAELKASKAFSLEKFSFKVCGNVDYLDTTNSLSHFRYNSIDYITQQINDNVVLYSYDSTSGFIKLKTFTGYRECEILNVNYNGIYMLTISKDNKLSIVRFNPSSNSSSVISLNVDNVQYACGFISNTEFIIYFSKLAEIYKGTFSTVDNRFVFDNTGRKGMKLYSGPFANKSYIIVDKFNNAKLITD